MADETENKTTEKSFTMSDLRNAILAVAAAFKEFGTFEPAEKLDEKGKPILDEKGKPVMVDGGAYVEVKSFEPFDTLKALAVKITEQGGRGIPTATRLESARAALDAHYLNVPTTNGKPNLADLGWRNKTRELDAAVMKLEKQLAKETATAAEKAKTETASK